MPIFTAPEDCGGPRSEGMNVLKTPDSGRCLQSGDLATRCRLLGACRPIGPYAGVRPRRHQTADRRDCEPSWENSGCRFTRRQNPFPVLGTSTTGLGQGYGATALDQACRRALSFDNLRLASLKEILEKGLWRQPTTPTRPTSPAPAACRFARPHDYFVNSQTQEVQ